MPKIQVLGYTNDEDWSLPIVALCWLAATIAIKRCWLVPYLERQCKTNAAQRQKLRTRRLRDTLADPFLVQDLERRLMIRYQGNTSSVLEAIDRMRQQVSNNESSPLASSSKSTTRNMGGSHENTDHHHYRHHHHHEEEEENDDYSPRGEEKKEAVAQILYGTFALAIALYCLQTFYMVSLFSWEDRSYGYVALQTIFVCVVHVMDSLQLYRRQHVRAAKRTSARCPCPNDNNNDNDNSGCSMEQGEGSPVQAIPPTPSEEEEEEVL
jgi:hypothetical protein